jgi:hypothetical protein
MRVEIDNKVRISSNKDISKYSHTILIRCQPEVYNKTGCIKIRFTRQLTNDVDYLCRLWWHLGLVKKGKVEKIQEGVSMGRGININNLYELTLVKIGAISFPDDSDYTDWTNEVNEVK